MDCLDEPAATLVLYDAHGYFAVVLVHRGGATLLRFAQDSIAAIRSLYEIAEAAAARGLILKVQVEPIEVLALRPEA